MKTQTQTTTFPTVSLNYMVKLTKATYSDVLAAVKTLGLPGHRSASGARVWTREEFERIAAQVAK